MLNDDSSVFDKSGLRRGVMQSVVPTSSQRRYRDHSISVGAKAEVTADNNKSKADKPRIAKCIYRGQVIED